MTTCQTLLSWKLVLGIACCFSMLPAHSFRHGGKVKGREIEAKGDEVFEVDPNFGFTLPEEYSHVGDTLWDPVEQAWLVFVNGIWRVGEREKSQVWKIDQNGDAALINEMSVSYETFEGWTSSCWDGRGGLLAAENSGTSHPLVHFTYPDFSREVVGEQNRWPHDLTFHDSSRKVFYVENRNSIWALNPDTGARNLVVGSPDVSHRAVSIAISPSGDHLYVLDRFCSVIVFTLTAGLVATEEWSDAKTLLNGSCSDGDRKGFCRCNRGSIRSDPKGNLWVYKLKYNWPEEPVGTIEVFSPHEGAELESLAKYESKGMVRFALGGPTGQDFLTIQTQQTERSTKFRTGLVRGKLASAP